jgi:hypothetical protein
VARAKAGGDGCGWVPGHGVEYHWYDQLFRSCAYLAMTYVCGTHACPLAAQAHRLSSFQVCNSMHPVDFSVQGRLTLLTFKPLVRLVGGVGIVMSDYVTWNVYF